MPMCRGNMFLIEISKNIKKYKCLQQITIKVLIFVFFYSLFLGSQVTALNIIDQYLYIGNTKGRIIVADAITLQPLCLFPAHSPRDFYIKCILSISSRQDLVFEADQAARSKGIVSVGRGYVDLLNNGGAGVRKRESLAEQERNQSRPGDGMVNHTYVLSWSAENWEYY